jgi:hypothetical protein
MADQGLVGGDAPAAAAAEAPAEEPAAEAEPTPAEEPATESNVAEGEREERASRPAGETDLTQED